MGVLGGISLMVCGAVVYGTTRGAANGSVPRNAGAGIRTGPTKASDEAWVAAHQAALRPSAVVSCLSLVSGAALIVAGALSDPENPSLAVYALFCIGYASLLAGAWWIVRVANRAALQTTPTR